MRHAYRLGYEFGPDLFRGSSYENAQVVAQGRGGAMVDEIVHAQDVLVACSGAVVGHVHQAAAPEGDTELVDHERRQQRIESGVTLAPCSADRTTNMMA